ncbi:uncharacterized protein B0I36DRAFT_406516 [Microdochium trichocladiopsis]|uniref:Transmembrane protein n=1 Tax=Microdochium trichocladiopsis TaxID=1682393 RepID=A0A9P8YD32_9PEZI|nr:uncharacterized protein B0I36DRAFT_406516 [Microdochium trichocladiopsis]KAH7035829.1 hypothetical protein B0I36DRAFT_406516 [Microdochium trichocladiopsis]
MQKFLERPTLDGKNILQTLGTLGGESFMGSADFAANSSSCYEAFLRLIGSQANRQRDMLGRSLEGTSIYPAVVQCFELSPGASFGFCLRGYYEQLGYSKDTKPSVSVDDQKSHSGQKVADMTLSNLEEPPALTASLRVGLDEILLSFNIVTSGHFIPIDASNAVLNLTCLDTSKTCEHAVDSPLSPESARHVAVRKVGMTNVRDKVNIYTTYGDPRAQFIAGRCTSTRLGCLLLKSCLNCGVQQARDGRRNSCASAPSDNLVILPDSRKLVTTHQLFTTFRSRKMAGIRVWYVCSQWLVVPFMILFAVTCLVTDATSKVNFDDRSGGFFIFAGIPVGMFGAGFNAVLNAVSHAAHKAVKLVPEKKSFSQRRITGWFIVGVRCVGVCVLVALAARYFQPPTSASAAGVAGLITA